MKKIIKVILLNKNIKKRHLYLLSILSGLLLVASWPQNGFPFLILFAFVPLLIIEHINLKNSAQNSSFDIVKYAAISFIIWNLLTTYWIGNAAIIGIIMAVILNTFFMCLAFWLFHIFNRKSQKGYSAYIFLIAYVLSFEFLTLRWDLNWPWLNIGNVFASNPAWIQWYEFTGVPGGTLWILTVNIFIFLVFKCFIFDTQKNKKAISVNLISLALIFIVPSLYSNIRYYSYTEEKNPIDVIVVQPNLNPYTEQYEIEPTVVTDLMLQLANSKIDSKTQLIFFPESAIQEYNYENSLHLSPSVQMINKYIKQNAQNAKVIAGISTKVNYDFGTKPSSTARKYNNADIYYDSYNTALLIDSNLNFQLRHKSKLTPGVEIMPFSKYLKFLDKLFLDFGGTVGSLGVDEYNKTFKINENTQIGTAICYESVFGEYYSNFVKNGANLMSVITNDGWWGDTPGYRQHMQMSVLRAIETRRSIARSANTGISCFVNQRGDIIDNTDYWVKDVRKQTLNLNNDITFYVKYGDFISRIFLLVAALSILTLIVSRLKKNNNIKK